MQPQSIQSQKLVKIQGIAAQLTIIYEMFMNVHVLFVVYPGKMDYNFWI